MRCSRPDCGGQPWRDESGALVCTLCGRSDVSIEPLPLVSDILLLVEPTDPASRGAGLLECRRVTRADVQRAIQRGLNAERQRRCRARARGAKEVA